MKKLLTIALAMIVMLSLSAIPAFAASELPDDGDIPYHDLQTDVATATDLDDDVDIDGYIGPDANWEDPEEPPKVYVINVSVPTKLIWAAFQSDEGTIKSPGYHILNNGGADADDLAVTIEAFTAKASNSDNDEVDKFVTLNLVKTGGEGFTVASTPLIAGNGSVPNYLNNVSAPIPLGTISPNINSTTTDANKWLFTLEGSVEPDLFDESDEDGFNPDYTLTLKFERV
jgi:hypothetical protein